MMVEEGWEKDLHRRVPAKSSKLPLELQGWQPGHEAGGRQERRRRERRQRD